MKRIGLSLAALCAVSACASEQESALAGPLTVPSLPFAHYAFAAAVHGDSLFIAGGHVGQGHDSSTDTYLNTFYELDLAAAEPEWKDLGGLDEHLQQSSLFVWDDTLYHLGGMRALNGPDEDKNLQGRAAMEVFDQRTSTWSALPDLIEPRASHDAVLVDDTLYLTGGWTLSGTVDTKHYYESTLALDLAASQPEWSVIDQPFQTRDHCGGTVDGKVYVLGGSLSGVFPRDVWVYDPADGGWTSGPELPTNTPANGFACAATSYRGELYFSAADGIVYRLDEERTGWEEIAVLETPRIFHRLVAYEGHLIALGGGTGPAVDALDSVEVIRLPESSDR